MQNQCKQCVMDTSAKEIVFDENGVCNFCHAAQKELASNDPFAVTKFFEKTKETHGDYNCLIGLSGGVDSSMVLHYAVKHGLKPLCFSIDNGYNKPEADENIMNLVESLKVPFFRYTIDLPKFRKLQSAFLNAGVINAEIPTDHILMAASYEMAAKYGIKTILSGGNVATESIMPASWSYNARDLTHIRAIFKKFYGHRLTGLPLCSIWKWNYYRWIKKIKIVYILDFFYYDRAKAEKMLIEQYNFKSTGEKHEENYFTWWFQNFYLFEKFGIDKRKAHYSSMINSGQMTREEALQKLEVNPVYPELGLEKKVFKYARHAHSDYKQDKWYGRIAALVKLCKS